MSATTTAANHVEMYGTKEGVAVRVFSEEQLDWVVYYVNYTCHIWMVRVFRTPYAQSVAVVYVNQKNLPENFRDGIAAQYTIVSSDPNVTRKRIANSNEIARRVAVAKSKLARHNLTSLKQAMVTIFGSPQSVKDAFKECGIAIRGHATLTQCLTLLEKAKLLKVVLEYMEASPSCEVALSTPFACVLATPLACPVALATPFASVLACPVDYSHHGEPCGPYEAVRITYEFMVKALTPMSLSKLRAHMKQQGIPGTGTRGYSQPQLLDHCLEYWFSRLS